MKAGTERRKGWCCGKISVNRASTSRRDYVSFTYKLQWYTMRNNQTFKPQNKIANVEHFKRSLLALIFLLWQAKTFREESDKSCLSCCENKWRWYQHLQCYKSLVIRPDKTFLMFGLKETRTTLKSSCINSICKLVSVLIWNENFAFHSLSEAWLDLPVAFV